MSDPGDIGLSVPVSNRRVRRVYDRFAGAYARTVARAELPTKRRAVERLAPEPGDRVLDLGCGPGLTLPALAAAVGPAGSVHGLDPAPGMLAESWRRIDGGARRKRIDLVRGDARRLPFARDAFDRVLAADVLELFAADDIDRVTAELRRVLRPDGLLCVQTMDRADRPDSTFLRAYETAYRRLPGFAAVGCRPIDVDAALGDAGFRIERRERALRLGVWPVVTVLARPPERG